MKRPLMLIVATVAILVALPIAWADPPERTPVIVLDQPGVPVRMSEIQSLVTLMPTGDTATTAWLVRGVMTDVSPKRIVAIETTWRLVGEGGEVVGAVTRVSEQPLSPGERRRTILAVLTELLYKPGTRVIGLVRRVRFEDGTIWIAPPADVAKAPKR